MLERLGSDLVRIDGVFYRRLDLTGPVVDVAELDGDLYVLYEGRDYYSPIGRYAAKRQALHRMIWSAAHGPIPRGYDIHHIDNNPRNNDLSNLACLSRAEHRRIHGATVTGEQAKPHLDAIRHLATEWHRSPEGRAWHREHGAASWADRPMRTLTCQQCGRLFETRHAGRADLCSTKCRNAAAAADPANYEDRACVGCGSIFPAWRWHKRRRFCSRSCAGRANASQRTYRSADT